MRVENVEIALSVKLLEEGDGLRGNKLIDLAGKVSYAPSIRGLSSTCAMVYGE